MHRTLKRLLPLAVVALVLGAFAGSASAVKYVALGDSYSSGTGTNSYTLSSSCLRSVYAYPYLVATARGDALTFAACSGATTTDVMNNQISSVTSDTGIVTITIGGNDVGFSNLIVSCTTLGCGSAIDSATSQIQNTLPGKLNTVYSAIKSRAPSAKIIVLGYPRMFSSSSCWGTTGIDSSERTRLNALADLLDQTIAGRAAAYGLTYKSAIGAFTGHAVCSSSAWLNGLNIFNTTESYHPNRSGHSSGYAPLVRAVTG
ncbi:MAG: SGNH/GDSL hydrolase family protein [Solirubrobacterales bacterium]|nr:SGNH/GDSL hydrolase family protein [Solirubrobacterales bacterium]